MPSSVGVSNYNYIDFFSNLLFRRSDFFRTSLGHRQGIAPFAGRSTGAFCVPFPESTPLITCIAKTDQRTKMVEAPVIANAFARKIATPSRSEESVLLRSLSPRSLRYIAEIIRKISGLRGSRLLYVFGMASELLCLLHKSIAMIRFVYNGRPNRSLKRVGFMCAWA